MTQSDPMHVTNEAAKKAAEQLFDVMADHVENVMIDLSADDETWGDLIEHGSAEALAVYEEPIFRSVMHELALMVLARGLGRYTERGEAQR